MRVSVSASVLGCLALQAGTASRAILGQPGKPTWSTRTQNIKVRDVKHETLYLLITNEANKTTGHSLTSGQ